MKKVLALVLSAAMALSLTACGGGSGNGGASAKPKDPKEVYTAAIKKNSELKSMDMSTKMDMTMKMGEESVNMVMDMDIQMDQINTDKMKYYASTKTTADDQTMDMVIFYTDGNYYMDGMGQKIKYPMDLDAMMEQVNQSTSSGDLDIEWLKELTMKEDGDNQILSFTADPAKMKDYVDTMMASMAANAQLDDMEMTINSVSGEYVVNKDGYYTAMKMTMDIDMSAQGQSLNMVMNLDSTINNPGGEVTVTIPSTDGFQEMNVAAPAA